jgi:hypothetical protein
MAVLAGRLGPGGGAEVRSSLTRTLETSHLVDEVGLVGCPRRRHDVEASRCLTCAHLLLAVRSADGELTEIRCTPPPGLIRTPWFLVWDG